MKLYIIIFLTIICITAARQRQERIIGGQVATQGQFPYQVAIFSGDSKFCAGALISDTTVLTCAHCVAGETNFTVHLGAQNLFQVPLEPGHVIVVTSEVKIHEMYQNITGFDYDIAVLTLPQPVSGQYISPVRLPALSQQNNTYTDELAVTSGWGQVDDLNPNLSEELRYAEVNITSENVCVSSYGADIISNRQICASTNAGTVGICSGDAGAPLTITEDDGLFTLVGIANFGSPRGCEKSEPNVYARTTYYLEWIQINAPDVIIRP